jgi:O-antigen ligase
MRTLPTKIRDAVAPAYLLLCLALGGSSQGVWANMVLQLLAIAIIAWAAIETPREPLSSGARQLLWCIALGFLVLLIQVIPLPPAIWSAVPGRGFVIEGYRTLGQPLPWLPLSLSPADSLTNLARLLPPLAILLAIVRLKAYRPVWLGWALILGTAAGVVLGTLQVTTGDPAASPWYLYASTNYGVAVGFFANGNHMAILLVATLPFLFAILARTRRDHDKKALQKKSAILALIIAMLLVVLLGLGLNRSLAGLGLGLPVIIASLILLADVQRQRRLLVVPAVLLVVAAATILALPMAGQLDKLGAGSSVESRRVVASTSWQAVKDFAPLGSGAGSFENIYRLYENAATVDRTYVNHAHNDYLEIAIETGIPGVLVLLLFLGWWTVTASQRWKSGSNDPFAKAATIASAAILAHSVVDFPLRTAAMGAVFAMCLALLVATRTRAKSADRPDLWQSRHLQVR